LTRWFRPHNDEIRSAARAAFQHRSGHPQWMRWLKAFGERISARHPDSQTAEIKIRVALINRFNAPGTAEIVRVP
jgi:hypothetical protein